MPINMSERARLGKMIAGAAEGFLTYPGTDINKEGEKTLRLICRRGLEATFVMNFIVRLEEEFTDELIQAAEDAADDTL